MKLYNYFLKDYEEFPLYVKVKTKYLFLTNILTLSFILIVLYNHLFINNRKSIILTSDFTFLLLIILSFFLIKKKRYIMSSNLLFIGASTSLTSNFIFGDIYTSELIEYLGIVGIVAPFIVIIEATGLFSYKRYQPILITLISIFSFLLSFIFFINNNPSTTLYGEALTVFITDSLVLVLAGCISTLILKMSNELIMLAIEKEKDLQENNRQLEHIVLERTNQLQVSNDKLNFISYHDTLTGLYNRRYFEEKLVELNKEDFLPLTIILGDIDFLKRTNDNYGHPIGDKLLTDISNILKICCNKKFIVFRIGGDEFGIIFSNSKEDEVKELINKIQTTALEYKCIYYTPSISIGYSTKLSLDKDLTMVIKEADTMLYERKKINHPSL